MPVPATLLAFLSLVLLAAGALLVQRSGARASIGRRLAGARGYAIGELQDLAEPPRRPVRVSGRVRCPNPIVTARGDQLVAYHRDVTLRTPAGWRTIERIRESRGFELWDHAGSVTLDAADAAEPLISIPFVWEGDEGELEEAFLPAVKRVRASEGVAAGDAPTARAVTRTLTTVDRLLVLARVERDDAGRVHLRPPPGGYLVSNLELPDAMRLLGGPARRALLAGVGLLVAGVAAGALAIGLAAAGALAG